MPILDLLGMYFDAAVVCIFQQLFIFIQAGHTVGLLVCLLAL